jgi:hypothetical protein
MPGLPGMARSGHNADGHPVPWEGYAHRTSRLGDGVGMGWLAAMGLGALGGAVVELIEVWGKVTDWQKARRDAMGSGRRPLPALSEHIDPFPDILVAMTRLLLGAVAGFLFHPQVTGIAAAIAVGASAPALLRQLGATSPVQGAVQGDGSIEARQTTAVDGRLGLPAELGGETVAE